MVFTLLSIRWLTFRNTLLRASRRERARARAGLLFSALIVGGVGAMSYQFFFPFADLAFENRSMQVILSRLPAFAFFSAFWMLMLSGVTVGIQSFYLNQEMPLLLSAPVSPRAIFSAKFLEATSTNTALFLTIGAPVLLAYSFARGYITPPYIVYLTLVLVAFCAIPSGIGILCSLLLMRALPPTRTRELLGALGVAAFACIYFVLSVSVQRVNDAKALQQGTARLATLMSEPLFARGPWAWAGDVLAGERTAPETWERILLLWGVALVTVMLAALAAHWLHWRGWANAQELPVQPTSAVSDDGWERRLAPLPGPMRAVLLKDLRSLRRDMRQLSLFFIPIAVVAVFLINVPQTPGIHRLPSALLALSLYPILAMIALRLAMSGFVTENRALWLMLSAPNDPSTILAGKFLYAYTLSLPLAFAATVSYSLIQQTSGVEWVINIAMVLCAVAGFTGIGVGASVLFSDFHADNPRFTISAGARFVTFLFQMGYLLLLTTITILAWMMSHWQGLPPALIYLIASAIILLLSGVVILLPLNLGAHRLRQMEWQ